MSATLMESGAVVERTGVRRPGMGSVLRSEWLKLTTVRSTWWTVLSAFAAIPFMLSSTDLELGSVDIHLRAKNAPTRWMVAAKLMSVLS